MRNVRKTKKRRYSLTISLYFTFLMMAVIAAVSVVSWVIAFLIEHFGGHSPVISEGTWLMIFSIVLGSAASIFTSRKFIAPITRLGRAMKKVSGRDFSVRLTTSTHIREIREIYENFNLMTTELGTAEILQTDFISGVSHEFKTPINAIEGYATLLQEENLSKQETGEYIDKILLNTSRLSELVGNILLLSKLENQAIQTVKTEYRADEQIRTAVLLLERKWTEKNIDLDIALDEISCTGQENLSMHIWVNLIDNAVKFAPAQGIVRLRLTRSEDNMIFTVEDNGCGIPAADREHIFDKFFQCETSRKGEGSGLGLSLVRRITDICGGRVTVESEEGIGTKFTVTLPVK